MAQSVAYNEAWIDHNKLSFIYLNVVYISEINICEGGAFGSTLWFYQPEDVGSNPAPRTQ